MSAKHIGEPWVWRELHDKRGKVTRTFVELHNSEGEVIDLGSYWTPHDRVDFESKETIQCRARRIVAAVNAVARIPVSALEAGVVGEMLETLEWLIDPAIRAIETGAYAGMAEMDRAKDVIARAKGESP